MATLTLNAGTASPITVECQRAGFGAPILVGAKSQSANGAERSSIRGQRRVAPVVTDHITAASAAAIRNAVARGAQIPCSGDLLGNIQTLCSVDIVDEHIVPSSGGLWEMALTLYEVNPDVVLLKYSPGDTITGESFTGPAGRRYYDAAGVVQTAGSNVKRDSHYIGGVRSLLLEGPATNLILWSNDFSNAAWDKSSATVGTGIADPAGGTTACTLTATIANAYISQTLAAGSSLVRTSSLWIRRRTGVGAVSLLSPDSGETVVTLTGTYQRFGATGAASTGRVCGVRINTSGDAIDVWMGQLEDGPFKTSEIATTTVAVTRSAESYSLPAPPPCELTVYAKIVEGGTLQVAGSRLFEISQAASMAPHFLCYNPSSVYRLYHDDPSLTPVTSTFAVGPSFGDTAEVVGRLFGDGSVDGVQSINAAAGVTSTQSAAKALSPAWSGPLVWLNSIGSGSHGFTAIQSFKIVAGARSLTEMRAA